MTPPNPRRSFPIAPVTGRRARRQRQQGLREARSWPSPTHDRDHGSTVTQALASVLSRRNHRCHSNSFRDLRDRRIPGAERYDRGTRYRHKRVVGCCLAWLPCCRASSIAPPSGTGEEGRFRREFALGSKTSCIPGARRQRSDEWCRPRSLPDKRARTSPRAQRQCRLARRGLPPLKKPPKVYASVLDQGP